MKLSFIPNKDLKVDKEYLVKTAGSLALMADFYEYSEEYQLNIQFERVYDGYSKMTINSKLINRIKTNDSFNYVFALLDFMEKLIIKVDFNGKIDSIYNGSTFRDEWEERRYDLKRTYNKDENIDQQLKIADSILSNKEKLIEFISQNGPFALLLYPCFLERETLESNIKLKDFLIDFDLPIVKNPVENTETKLVFEGSINNESFDKRPFVKFLKEKTDIYNLKALLDLDYEEKYEYKGQTLVAAEHYFAAGVMGCFSNTIARTLIEKKNES